ncbi:MAG TPA: sialidase family protein [Vicinamibacterales bacterium]|nr:sialidase family protein [Vicinamibacterales bacterium]
MNGTQRFVCALAALTTVHILAPTGSFLAPATELAVSAAPLNPTVSNVQVNQVFAGPFLRNRQVEPSLAQNPTNPLNLVASSIDAIGQQDCTNTTPSTCTVSNIATAGFYASFDGGLTWPCQGLLDLASAGYRGGADPVQAFDSRGTVYFAVIGGPIPSSATRDQVVTGLGGDILVASSVDGGCTYGPVTNISNDSPEMFDDKQAIAADASPDSPYRDNVYAAWTSFALSAGQIVFTRSTNRGRTWSQPRPISPANQHFNKGASEFRQGAAIKVGPDGTVYVAWMDAAAQRPAYMLAMSRDGGRSFSNPAAIVPVEDELIFQGGRTVFLPGTRFVQFGRVLPSLAIGSNGHLHVSWSEYTSGHAVVKFVTSADGESWTPPQIIADVPGRSAIFNALSTDGASNVHLVFQAIDDVPPGTAPGAGVTSYATYYTRSVDNGLTFASPVAISTAESDPAASSSVSLLGQSIGDYIVTVSDGNHTYAVWTDSRNASSCAAVDLYRTGLASKPNIITLCPVEFGNTDIYLAIVGP